MIQHKPPCRANDYAQGSYVERPRIALAVPRRDVSLGFVSIMSSTWKVLPQISNHTSFFRRYGWGVTTTTSYILIYTTSNYTTTAVTAAAVYVQDHYTCTTLFGVVHTSPIYWWALPSTRSYNIGRNFGGLRSVPAWFRDPVFRDPVLRDSCVPR